MPPKGWRKTPEGFKPTNSSGASLSDRRVYSLQDLLLPRALVMKIAKMVLPPGTQLPKDGVTALMRSATVFIGYITAEANSIARLAGRKTVMPQDVTKALESLQFGAFVAPVEELTAQMADPKLVEGETTAEEKIVEDVEPETIALADTSSSKKQRQMMFKQMVIVPPSSADADGSAMQTE